MSSGVGQELIKLNNRLKKISDGHKEYEEAYSVFEVLEALEVDSDSIHKSRIALTINELRKKTKDEKLAKRGKALIRKWKSQIEDSQVVKKPRDEVKKSISKDTTPPSDDSNSGFAYRKGSSESEAQISKTVINNYHVYRKGLLPSEFGAIFKQKGTRKKFVQNIFYFPPRFSPPFEVCSRAINYLDMPKDQKRASIVNILLKSLKTTELPEHTQDPEGIATRIEAALYERFGDISQDYFNAARSRASNLRDKKNPHLRENVLTGAVSAEKFANMTTEEMASDAMKQQREAFTKEAIMEHQMAVQEGTPSDMFKCGRCGKNNCTYTQVQTRSADEPMTTFVFCRTCGNRWKFC